MIFNIGNHIEQIINGTKTQTRRNSIRYEVNKTYAVQLCRTCKGIPEGRILITESWMETTQISKEDAKDEGGYTPEEFEELYEDLYHYWGQRVVYRFRFVPTKETLN